MAPIKASTPSVSTPTVAPTTNTTAPNQTLLNTLHNTLSKSVDTSLNAIGEQLLSKHLSINLPAHQQRQLSAAVGLSGLALTTYILNKVFGKIVSMLTMPKPTIANKDYDVIVIGAGIGGCALGSVLSKAGRKVLVLERDMSEPDRIVGELLQPGGVEHLQELGLGHCVEGIEAAKVYGYQVFYKDEQVNMPYPVDPKSTVGQRVEGRAFHYGRFIMNLRRACEKDG